MKFVVRCCTRYAATSQVTTSNNGNSQQAQHRQNKTNKQQILYYCVACALPTSTTGTLCAVFTVYQRAKVNVEISRRPAPAHNCSHCTTIRRRHYCFYIVVRCSLTRF